MGWLEGLKSIRNRLCEEGCEEDCLGYGLTCQALTVMSLFPVVFVVAVVHDYPSLGDGLTGRVRKEVLWEVQSRKPSGSEIGLPKEVF